MDEKEVKPNNNNLDYDIDDTGSKIIDWFKKNIVNLFIVGLSIYFVFNGAITIVPNEMHLWEKCVYIFTTMIFGLIISSLVGDSGYQAGKENEKYITARDEADMFCEKVLPWRNQVELYVSNKIDNDIKQERIEILAKASINYDEIFNQDDIPYPYKDIRKEYTRKQRKAIIQAIHIKKVPFTLFGVTAIKTVGRKEAPNEVKRRKSKFTSSFLLKAIMAIVSGSVAFQFIGISVSSIIYSAFQILLWVGSGLIARVSNYNFIVNNVCNYYIEKSWYIKEFLALPETEKEKLTQQVLIKENERATIKRIGMIVNDDKEQK